MPEPFESRVEIKLGEHTLCVLAMWQREDGSYSIVGMRDIVDGEFVSRKAFKTSIPEQAGLGYRLNEEVSRLYANGGELFVINHVELHETAEELRALMGKMANKDNEPNSKDEV